MFATLDDSLFYKNDIYVYTHSLVIYDQEPIVLSITGDKKSIYDENKIYNFLEKNLIYYFNEFEDMSLFACNHYRRYPDIWDFCESLPKKPTKLIKESFIKSHFSSKIKAKQMLEQILENVNFRKIN